MPSKVDRRQNKNRIFMGAIISGIVASIIILVVFLVKFYSKGDQTTTTTTQKAESTTTQKAESTTTQQIESSTTSSETETSNTTPSSGIGFSSEQMSSEQIKFILKQDGTEMTFQNIKDLYNGTLNGVDGKKVEFSPLVNVLRQILAKETKFDAYYFEVIKVQKSELNTKVFEFVLIKTSIKNIQDAATFGTKIENSALAVVFDSTSSPPAKLVCPHKGTESYNAHLAIYARNSSDEEFEYTWRLAFKTFFEDIDSAGNKVRYLSTHGQAVLWLHIRIESTPKYYHYNEYK
eukprot:GAHX01002488.1.p1 GENE.GAHX01002488.1~~GAHX01002488.1.p1  ORF type:complete len:291 (+),score=45.59 GAHX01002488.1:50-922(+)